MYGGRLVETGPIDDIFNHTSHPYTKGLLDSIPKIEEKIKRLNAIPGQVPNPMDLPQGCKFHPRCSMAVEECRNIEPQLFKVNGNHFSRCFRWKDCC